MNRISERTKSRVARAKDRITRAYRHEEGVVPWLVVDTPYWLFGEAPETISETYFTSAKSQFEHQMALIAAEDEGNPWAKLVVQGQPVFPKKVVWRAAVP